MTLETLDTTSLPVLVLAGGFGTRLRARVDEWAKPLAPVAGRPFLAHQLDWLHTQGCREAILSVHYRAEQFHRFTSEYDRMALKVCEEREASRHRRGGVICCS